MHIRQNKVGFTTDHDGEGHRVSCGRKRRGRRFRKSSHQEQDEASSYLTAVQCLYAFASWFGRGVRKTNKILTFSHCCKTSTENGGDEESSREVHSGGKISSKTSSKSANHDDIGSPMVEKHHSGIGNKSNSSVQLDPKKAFDKISTINDKETLSYIDHERYNDGKRGNALPPLGIPGTKSPRNVASGGNGETSKVHSNADSQKGSLTKDKVKVVKELSDSKSPKDQDHDATSMSFPPVLTGILPQSGDKSVDMGRNVPCQGMSKKIDDNMIKFMEQLDDQKKSLIRGLESIASAKLWFEKSLDFVKEKQSQMNLNINEDSALSGRSTSSENICNKVSQSGDSLSNFKIDNIAETEQQLQSLINTANRLEQFVASSKIWTMGKADDVKPKVIDESAHLVTVPGNIEATSTLSTSNANVAENKSPLQATSPIGDASNTELTSDANVSHTTEVKLPENDQVTYAITKRRAYDPFYDEPICKVRPQYTMGKKNEVNKAEFSSNGNSRSLPNNKITDDKAPIETPFPIEDSNNTLLTGKANNVEDNLNVEMSSKEISQMEKEVEENKSPLPSASPIGDTDELASATNESHDEKVEEKKINDTHQDDEKSKSNEESQKLGDEDCEDDYEDDFDSDTDESSKSSNELPSDDELSPSAENYKGGGWLKFLEIKYNIRYILEVEPAN
ncbi:uncharacterized protein LOC120332662 [Styela clava]